MLPVNLPSAHQQDNKMDDVRENNDQRLMRALTRTIKTEPYKGEANACGVWMSHVCLLLHIAQEHSPNNAFSAVFANVKGAAYDALMLLVQKMVAQHQPFSVLDLMSEMVSQFDRGNMEKQMQDAKSIKQKPNEDINVFHRRWIKTMTRVGDSMKYSPQQEVKEFAKAMLASDDACKFEWPSIEALVTLGQQC